MAETKTPPAKPEATQEEAVEVLTVKVNGSEVTVPVADVTELVKTLRAARKEHVASQRAAKAEARAKRAAERSESREKKIAKLEAQLQALKAAGDEKPDEEEAA
jgi:hypothetical protein